MKTFLRILKFIVVLIYSLVKNGTWNLILNSIQEAKAAITE